MEISVLFLSVLAFSSAGTEVRLGPELGSNYHHVDLFMKFTVVDTAYTALKDGILTAVEFIYTQNFTGTEFTVGVFNPLENACEFLTRERSFKIEAITGYQKVDGMNITIRAGDMFGFMWNHYSVIPHNSISTDRYCGGAEYPKPGEVVNLDNSGPYAARDYAIRAFVEYNTA